MITARDVISPVRQVPPEGVLPAVAADMPLVDVLHRLLEAPGRELAVTDSGRSLGVADQNTVIEGLGRMLAPRDDSSMLSVECPAADYSASHIARAVEDSDAHLVDLWTVPADGGRVAVTLRVRHTDPTAVCRSLERYGYEVTDTHGGSGAEASVTAERLEALRMFLDI